MANNVLIQLMDNCINSIENIIPRLRESPSDDDLDEILVRQHRDASVLSELIRLRISTDTIDVADNYNDIIDCCYNIRNGHQVDRNIKIISKRLREVIGYCAIELANMEV